MSSMDPTKIAEAVKTLVPDMKGEIVQKTRVTPSTQKFDKDKDLELDKKELRAKQISDITTIRRIQLNGVRYRLVNWGLPHGDVKKITDAQIEELIDDSVTLENSSTAAPPPSIWEKAGVKVVEYIPVVIVLAMFWFAIQIVPLFMGG